MGSLEILRRLGISTLKREELIVKNEDSDGVVSGVCTSAASYAVQCIGTLQSGGGSLGVFFIFFLF